MRVTAHAQDDTTRRQHIHNMAHHTSQGSMESMLNMTAENYVELAFEAAGILDDDDALEAAGPEAHTMHDCILLCACIRCTHWHVHCVCCRRLPLMTVATSHTRAQRVSTRGSHSALMYMHTYMHIHI